MELLRDLGKSFLSGQPHNCIRTALGRGWHFLLLISFQNRKFLFYLNGNQTLPPCFLFICCLFVEFSVVLFCFILGVDNTWSIYKALELEGQPLLSHSMPPGKNSP